jgi:hypothetical protein
VTRIYVAGSSHPSQRDRVKRFLGAVASFGYVQTHDWVQTIELVERGRVATQPFLDECAARDFEGVCAARVFVLLIPPPGLFSSAYVELGIALGARVPRILTVGYEEPLFVGACRASPLLLTQDGRHFPDDEAALACLRDEAPW